MEVMPMISFNIVLFDDFETLDAFGPAEIIGTLSQVYNLKIYSLAGGIIKSKQMVLADTLPLAEIDTSGVLLIPGGIGTRKVVNDKIFIEQLRYLADNAANVLTVCTGSALLAKTNLLNGLKATSNKAAFEWACSNGPEVKWVKKARWVKDSKFYTSSGVSAGMDMTLGFICDTCGMKTAQDIANYMEYIWNPNMDNDPFAIE
jgi:putative intracellular protease/amidase